MRTLFAALPLAVLVSSASVNAAGEIALLVAPVEGRAAESEEDWVQMVPAAFQADDEYCDSPTLLAQAVSEDRKMVFQEVCRWVTSNFIVSVDLATGERRAVSAGSGLQIITEGPARGYLLVSRHEYWPQGGSYDPTYVVAPNGETAMMVPGTDGDDPEGALASWLGETGNQAE